MLLTVSHKEAFLILSTSVTGLLAYESENTFNGSVEGFNVAMKRPL